MSIVYNLYSALSDYTSALDLHPLLICKVLNEIMQSGCRKKGNLLSTDFLAGFAEASTENRREIHVF